MRVFNALNYYFFDAEPDEPIDWASVAIYYGSLALSVGVSIALLLLKLV